jgi:hypothetical protein
MNLVLCARFLSAILNHSTNFFHQFRMSSKNTWADREIVRINALPNADLIMELHSAMNGHTYSWRSIQRCLQHLDTDNNVSLDWSDLCSLKQTWDRMPSLTRERQSKDIAERLSQDPSHRAWDLKYLRALLISLKLILIRAGLAEEEGILHQLLYMLYILRRR